MSFFYEALIITGVMVAVALASSYLVPYVIREYRKESKKGENVFFEAFSSDLELKGSNEQGKSIYANDNITIVSVDNGYKVILNRKQYLPAVIKISNDSLDDLSENQRVCQDTYSSSRGKLRREKEKLNYLNHRNSTTDLAMKLVFKHIKLRSNSDNTVQDSVENRNLEEALVKK